MKLKLTALLLTVGLVVIYAQRPGGPRGAAAPGGGERMPPMQALVDYLGLTDTQLESLQAIRENARTAAEPTMEQVRAKQMELRQAVRNDAGEAAIAALEVEIEDLRDELTAIRESGALQAKGSLSGDQQALLTSLEAAAQLQREVRAATGAGLIAGPEGDGPGFGPGGGRGKGGRGPGGRGPGGFGPGGSGGPQAE